MALNSVFENTAYIYFDFNPPIITNTTFNINGYVGVENKLQEEITLYPNPTTNAFTIRGIAQGEVSIYSITGQFISQQSFDTNTKIDLSKLQKGMYLVKLKAHAEAFMIQKD